MELAAVSSAESGSCKTLSVQKPHPGSRWHPLTCPRHRRDQVSLPLAPSWITCRDLLWASLSLSLSCRAMDPEEAAGGSGARSAPGPKNKQSARSWQGGGRREERKERKQKARRWPILEAARGLLGWQRVVVAFAALALAAQHDGRGQEQEGGGDQQQEPEAGEDPHHLEKGWIKFEVRLITVALQHIQAASHLSLFCSQGSSWKRHMGEPEWRKRHNRIRNKKSHVPATHNSSVLFLTLRATFHYRHLYLERYLDYGIEIYDVDSHCKAAIEPDCCVEKGRTQAAAHVVFMRGWWDGAEAWSKRLRVIQGEQGGEVGLNCNHMTQLPTGQQMPACMLMVGRRK